MIDKKAIMSAFLAGDLKRVLIGEISAKPSLGGANILRSYIFMSLAAQLTPLGSLVMCLARHTGFNYGRAPFRRHGGSLLPSPWQGENNEEPKHRNVRYRDIARLSFPRETQSWCGSGTAIEKERGDIPPEEQLHLIKKSQVE